IAAAITVIAVGGGSFALLSRTNPNQSIPAPHVAAAATPTPIPDSQFAPSAVTPPTASREIAATDTDVREAELPVDDDVPETGVESRLNNLNEQQLKALLNDIGQMKAVPVTEPDPITIKVDSKSSSRSGDTEMM